MLSKLKRFVATGFGAVDFRLDGQWEPFCWAPWTHSHLTPSGQRGLCCVSDVIGEFEQKTVAQYWNSSAMRRLRRRMRRHSPPAACEDCQKRSSPQYHGFNSIPERVKSSLRAGTAFTGKVSAPPFSFDYRPSNHCNFKCRMCGPRNSSSWEMATRELRGEYALDRREREKGRIVPFMDSAQAELMNAIEGRQVRSIYWAGGEPLQLDFHWRAMKRIVELGYADQVSVTYNTNLSVLKFRGQHFFDEVIRYFPTCFVGASLDATGEIGEYIRTGLKWPAWRENFLELKRRSAGSSQEVSIALCLTTLGLVDLKNLLRFSEESEASIASQMIHFDYQDVPSMHPLSPFALPRKLLDRCVDEALEDISPLRSSRNESVFRELEFLKKQPVWQETHPAQYDQLLRRQIKEVKEWEAYLDPEKKKPGFADFLSRKAYFQEWLDKYW